MKNSRKVEAAKRAIAWASLTSKEDMRKFFCEEMGPELCSFVNEYALQLGNTRAAGFIFLGYLMRIAESRSTFMAVA